MRMEENTQRMRVRRKGEGNDGRRERRVDDRKKRIKRMIREKKKEVKVQDVRWETG